MSALVRWQSCHMSQLEVVPAGTAHHQAVLHFCLLSLKLLLLQVSLPSNQSCIPHMDLVLVPSLLWMLHQP